MAKKEKLIDCKNCIFNGDKCTHISNKIILVKYRQEKELYLKTPEELNKSGNCKNYVEFSKK